MLFAAMATPGPSGRWAMWTAWFSREMVCRLCRSPATKTWIKTSTVDYQSRNRFTSSNRRRRKGISWDTMWTGMTRPRSSHTVTIVRLIYTKPTTTPTIRRPTYREIHVFHYIHNVLYINKESLSRRLWHYITVSSPTNKTNIRFYWSIYSNGFVFQVSQTFLMNTFLNSFSQ